MRDVLNRREYLQLTTGATGAFALSGCTGNGNGNGNGDGSGNGNGNGDGSGQAAVPLPSITNRSGPGSENGIPIAEAEGDLIQYMNDENLLEIDLEYHDRDAAYDPTQILEVYESFKNEYEPGLILGDGSPSGHTLAEQTAADEILHIIPFGTLSPAVGVENSYHATISNDYITQNRAALKLIEQEDPGAKVNLIVPPGNPAGVESAPALEYADELDLEKGEVVDHELGAASADSLMEQMASNDVNWAVHTTGAPAHTVVLSSRAEVYPELNLVGVGPACTERRAAQSPDLYEGTYWVSSMKTFDEVAFGDGPGADVLQTVWDRYRDNDIENADPEVAVVDYIRGMAAIDLAKRVFEITLERGADPTSGPDLRESFYMIEGHAGWETMAPRTYAEEDPRGNMAARAYVAADGEWDFLNEIVLDRDERWLPSEML